MTRIRVNEHFYADEYLPFMLYKEYAKRKKVYRLMERFDDRLLNADLEIRKHLDTPMTINNWWSIAKDRHFEDNVNRIIDNTHWLRQWSGARTKDSSNYSIDSMHTYYNASDSIADTRSWLAKAQLFIIENWKDLGITFMEVGISWLHKDTRNIPKLKLYNPYTNSYVNIQDYKCELLKKLK